MSDEQEPSKISADGTFYDDEVSKLNGWYIRCMPSSFQTLIKSIILKSFWKLDSAPVKQGISDSMKARLMAEANTGLDSNSKQTNVLLYICVGVAVLVALGGSGILY